MAEMLKLVILSCFYSLCESRKWDITVAFHPENIQAYEHSNVKFLCILHGELTDLTNHMEYSWLKDGAPFIPDYNDQDEVDILKGNLVLHISDVKLSDEGQYQCVVKHRIHVIAISRPGNLTVQVITPKKYPQCVLSKQLYAEGDEVTISCISETKGNFDMKWFDPLPGTELRRKTDFTTLFASFEATKQQHGKNYKCLTTIEGEQVPRVCSTDALNITNQLHVYTTTAEFMYTGEPVNITCNTQEHFEGVSFEWILENCNNNVTNRLNIKNEQIYINTIEMNMNGCHVTCKASKNMATGNFTYVMKVAKNYMPTSDYLTLVQASIDHSQTVTVALKLALISCITFVFIVVAALLIVKKIKHCKNEISSIPKKCEV